MGQANKIRESEVVGRTSPDVDELIRKVQARDEAALQLLLQRYKRLVRGVAVRMLCNAPEVDDIENEVGLQVWNKIDQFHIGKSFSSWIKRISVRFCLTELRKRREEAERMIPLIEGNGGERYGRFRHAEDNDEDDRTSSVVQNNSSDRHGRWFQNVERNLDIAWQVKGQFKLAHRLIILLAYWQRKPISEVATSTQETQDHVRYVLRLFRKKLCNTVKTHLSGQRPVVRPTSKKVAR
jgi:RNA polymerase sigma factor (sigma-70 family)